MKCVFMYLSLVLPVVLCNQICRNNSQSDGCSIPLGLPFFYKDQFEPACNIHDICYFCGTRYGLERIQCDTAFHQNLDSICNSLRKRFLLNFTPSEACKTSAWTYYEAVHFGAASHYENPSPAWCDEAWVKPCLTETI